MAPKVVVGLSRAFSVVLSLLAIVGAGASRAYAQCTPHWDPFAPAGLNDVVYVLHARDSGSGLPTLYAGGEFDAAGGTDASNIAGWNDSSWLPLGAGMTGQLNLTTGVYAVTFFDDDGAGPNPAALFAGGRFDFAGGVTANHIAKWDGSSWSALASGVGGVGPDDVHALTVFDDDGNGPNPAALYAGGEFSTAGGVTVNCIARWDGSSWSALGAGTGGYVYTLTVFDDDGPGPHAPALYAGGSFASAGGIAVSNIAMWDGSSWSALGSGVSGSFAYVSALAVFDPDASGPGLPVLVAGGEFTLAGGVAASRIAQWNGSSWSSLGSGVDNDVFALSVFDEDVGGPSPPALFAGGFFLTAGGVVASGIARWDGVSWSALGTGMDSSVRALAVFDDDGAGPAPPALYAGGSFTTAGGVSATRVAKWNASSWSALGNGTNGTGGDVSASIVFDVDGVGAESPTLVLGGAFSTAGGTTANRIAAWDGTAWSALGSGMNGDVLALSVVDLDGAGPAPPTLFAAGAFTTAGGANTSYIARWAGTSWSALGGGVNDIVLALAAFDADGAGPIAPVLIAGGYFTVAGGLSASRVAAWDGSVWSPLGNGTNKRVEALASFDVDGAGPLAPALIAGGFFTNAGVVAASSIAAWDGTSWSALGGGVQSLTPGFTHVHALVTFDDNAGSQPPALFAGGTFVTAGGVSASRVAKWDGSTWSPLGSGTNAVVRALSVFDDDGVGPIRPALYAGGSFDDAGGVWANGIARWDGSSWSALGIGVNGAVYTLSVFDEDGSDAAAVALCAGGAFTQANGSLSANVARWVGCGSSIQAFCPGDGTSGACPCGNSGAVGHGCENSAVTGGAILSASGHAGLAHDTLVLSSSGELPSVLSVFLQGTTSIAPIFFGDGLRCVGGDLKRLYIRNAVGGLVTVPQAGDLSVSARSATLGDPIPTGATRHYQTYYRDPVLAFCSNPPGDGWNVSNGLSAVWNP